jgi:hypothetical protein
MLRRAGLSWLVLLLAVCAFALVASTVCEGAQSVKLHVGLAPERLGEGTTIEFGFQIAAPTGQVPAALTGLSLSYPSHFGIATSGLGLETCSPRVLEELGPKGCPVNSWMGYGTALAEVQIGPEILQEHATTSVFMGPIENETISLIFWAGGVSPVSAEIVFPGLLLPAPAPFGGDLAITIPLVEGLPGGPDVAVVRLRATIGPRRLTYRQRIHGKRVGYRPPGIILPPRCPRDGFLFVAGFTFQDNTTATARSRVPCPPTRARTPRRVKAAATTHAARR